MVAEAKGTAALQPGRLKFVFLHSALLRLPPLSSPKVNPRKKLNLSLFYMSSIDPTVAVF